MGVVGRAGATGGGAVLLPRHGRRWIGSVFGTLPTGTWRHRPADAARAVAGALVVAITATAVADLSGVDRWLLQAVDPIPATFDGLLSALVWLGVAAPVVLVAAAAAGRRWRLLLAIGTSVAIAGGVAAVLGAVVEPVSAAVIEGADIGWSGSTVRFPALAVTLLGAVVLGGAPFLTRPSRRLAVAGLGLVAVAQLCLVEQLPLALLGGLALAWAAAAVAHLAWGSPAGVPRPSEVAAALADLGLTVTEVGDGHDEAVGVRRFEARAADGRELSVRVVGQEAVQFGLVQQAVRRVWRKDAGSSLPLARRAGVEHQALLLLLAERAGVGVPVLVAAGTGGALDDPMIVTAPPPGTPLDELDPSALTDAVLERTWAALARLHEAGIAHGDLRAANVVVASEGAIAFDGFGHADTLRDQAQADADRAALLLATAGSVGAGRAAEALGRSAGAPGLEAVLPLLQPAAFSSPLRRSVPDARHLVPELRRATAAAAGVEPPELVELRRVSPGSLLMALGALVGAYLLVGELASVDGLWSMLTSASLGWVAVVAVLSQTPQVAQAVGMIGSVMQPIPLGPATAVQFANQFMGLIGGTVATTALVIRYFQRMGLAVAVAISSGILNTLAAMVTQVVLVGLAVLATLGDWTLPSSTGTGGGDGGGAGRTLVAIVLVAVAVAVGAALTLPKLRRRLLDRLRPQLAAARDNLRQIAGEPRKAVELFGGAAASQLLFALTLGAALLAYGEPVGILMLLVVNSFASLLGGIAPIPGGLGVIEAGLIIGLVAAGVPQEEATAATFTHRLFTAYLPPIWGWASLRWLRRHSYV
jgi:uncharacterized membrane protein YbhN (UPF0104 family)/tRNA A-37 threonylcarbamoyl transferase component Bud32